MVHLTVTKVTCTMHYRVSRSALHIHAGRNDSVGAHTHNALQMQDYLELGRYTFKYSNTILLLLSVYLLVVSSLLSVHFFILVFSCIQ